MMKLSKKFLVDCPTEHEVVIRRHYCRIVSERILKIVQDSISTSEKLVFNSSLFAFRLIPSMSEEENRRILFAHAMTKVGEFYANDETIEVAYYKPEVDGKIDVQFTVKNLKLISTRKEMEEKLTKKKNG